MDYFNKDFSRLKTFSYKWDRVGSDILPFSVADSDYPAPPEIISALKERVEHGAFGYTYLDSDYYTIVQNWVQMRYHYHIEKEWIIPTTGVLTSLVYTILSLTKVNSKILIFTPVYNPFYDIIKDCDRILVESKLLETKNYQMNFQEVEKIFQDGLEMVILCSPHNPVGRVWTKGELNKLVSLAKKYNVILLADEIHCDLIIGENSFVSVGDFYSDYENIISVFAPSKTFNLAGLSLSNMIVPNPNFRNKIQRYIDILHIRPNLLAVTACKAAYLDCAYWVDLQNAHLTKQYLELSSFFKEKIPEAKIAPLEGTYLAWVDFRFLGLSSAELSKALLEYKVLINRGDYYGDDYDGFIRINLACSKEQLRAGLNGIYKFLEDFKR